MLTIFSGTLLWLKGTVKLHFTNDGSESGIKDRFTELIEVCFGYGPEGGNDLEEAIRTLFSYILSLRLGNRIEGIFIDSPRLETRIGEMEKRLNTMNGIVEQLVKWLVEEAEDGA